MSLTVVDVLALPGLDSMHLRAGQAGRDNAVRWPYVAENEGIADWVMGGELIFVTGINHPRDEANLLRLVCEGHERVVAGLVILTGAEFIQAMVKLICVHFIVRVYQSRQSSCIDIKFLSQTTQ